jgi:hypothetical protein
VGTQVAEDSGAGIVVSHGRHGVRREGRYKECGVGARRWRASVWRVFKREEDHSGSAAGGPHGRTARRHDQAARDFKPGDRRLIVPVLDTRLSG